MTNFSRSYSCKKVQSTCVKSVQIRSFSGPYFPVFGLNTERYFVSLRIQSEYGKIRTKKTPYLDTFHAVPFIHKSEVKYISQTKSYFVISCLKLIINELGRFKTGLDNI